MVVTDDRVAAFVAKTCGVVIHPPFTAMGIERAGEVIAGAVFNNWTGADIHVSFGGRGWTKGFLADVGHYVFDQLRCERMTFITEQPSIVRLAEKAGGQVEGYMRNQFGKDRPGFLVGVLKSDWRY